MPRQIITDRLTLRPYAQTDGPRLAACIARPGVQKWLPKVPHPYGLSDAVEFIERAKDDPWKLAVSLDGELIGGIALAGQFGYWLAEPHWGRGYATEASRALLDAWFGQAGGDVASGHVEGNRASRNVLVKLGFEDTDRGETQSQFLGRTVTLQHMKLAAASWRAAA